MFSSVVKFSGTADRTARYFRFEHIQDGGRRHLRNISNGHISATGPIHFMFGYRVGSNGAIFDSNKFKIAAAAILDMNGHISATAHDLLIARIARLSLR